MPPSSSLTSSVIELKSPACPTATSATWCRAPVGFLFNVELGEAALIKRFTTGNRRINPPQPRWSVDVPTWDQGCIIENWNTRPANDDLSTDELGLKSWSFFATACWPCCSDGARLVRSTIRRDSARCLAFRYFGTKELWMPIFSFKFCSACPPCECQHDAPLLLSKRTSPTQTAPTQTAMSTNTTIVLGAPQGLSRASSNILISTVTLFAARCELSLLGQGASEMDRWLHLLSRIIPSRRQGHGSGFGHEAWPVVVMVCVYQFYNRFGCRLHPAPTRRADEA